MIVPLDRIRRMPTWQITLALALMVLGFLIVAQARAEPSRVRYTTQERPPLVETATQLQAQQQQLTARILDLRSRIEQVETAAAGNDSLVAGLNDRLQQVRLDAGLVALEGPGLVIQLEDSSQPIPPNGAAGDYMVGSSDLRDVINELWLDGAEAVAVNGERVTVTSALTDIGSSILLDGAYLQPPYQVVAIGPKDLYDRVTSSANFADFVRQRVQGFGIKLGAGALDSAVVPAYAGTVGLTYAGPAPSRSPAATPSGAAP